VFLEPFGLASPGGGSRILRALLQDAPLPWASICSGPRRPPATTLGREIHVPTRPYFGRIERTRFHWIPSIFELNFAKSFERRLERTCVELGASAIHTIPQRHDFVHGYRVARRLGLPYFLNVHDDPTYMVPHRATREICLGNMPEIWRDSDERFVISDAMGAEYCTRYGQRPFEVVTDGIERLSEPRATSFDRLDIYFMGLFHISYGPNLQSLLRALRHVGGGGTSMTCRCGVIQQHVIAGARNLTVLPFGSEADVEADMAKANLLYLPLPFGEKSAPFVRFSLSTKLITYLGSGIPILYHGPEDSAACRILREHDAAVIVSSLDPDAIAAELRKLIAEPGRAAACVRNALQLAKRRFMLADQRERFWGAIQRNLVAKPAPVAG
jgi:glycosyltransferase involved in cell wall biosynthesis